MGLKIKTGGTKSTSKRSTAPRRNRATGPANAVKDKQSTRSKPAKRQSKTAKSTRTTRAKSPERRSPKTDLSQSQLKKFLNPLNRHATKRDKLKAEWLEEVELAQTAMLEALDAGVPVGLVMKSAQVSRQHIYKVLKERAEATNGSGSKSRAKTAAKSGVTKPSKRKPAAAKSSKKSSGRPKLRSR